MRNKNQVLRRQDKKPIVFDAFYNKTAQQKPLVIFCHGYKGFKDWGSWHLVAETCKAANLFFVKFNFSHNGGNTDNPIDFPDLDAFAENNYSKELDDLKAVIDYFSSENSSYSPEIDSNSIFIIGHSRGGGIASIKAAEDPRITTLITWASVCDFAERTATIGHLEKWKKEGVTYVLNSRTKQQMPHNYQFYQDFKANESRLNIKAAVEQLKIPHLIIHAKEDPSVSFNEAESLHLWNKHSELLPIENSDHVFGAKHPWTANSLPIALSKVVTKSIQFIKTSQNFEH